MYVCMFKKYQNYCNILHTTLLNKIINIDRLAKPSMSRTAPLH